MANHDHIIYKNNPVLLKSYVNKRCAVTASDKSRHTGIVYTVDPVTESIVLIEDANTPEQRLKFVIGHAVQKVDVLSEDVEDVPRLFQQNSLGVSQKLVTERKEVVMNLLRENRFPIIENNDIIEMKEVFSIKPPYAPENCVSMYPAVLSSIHKILSQLT